MTAYILMLWPAPKFATPEWVAFSLAKQAFGGDIAGRLWQLRQKEGLAYSVWAKPAPLREQPLATVTMGTALANKEKALAALDRELGLAATVGFSEADLARVKTSYVAALDRQDSTAMARSERLAHWWQLGAPADYRAKLRKMVEQATLEQVNAAAASVLKPGAYWLVEAGQQAK
jgi:predicted Zn-dependent peptidase